MQKVRTMFNRKTLALALSGAVLGLASATARAELYGPADQGQDVLGGNALLTLTGTSAATMTLNFIDIVSGPMMTSWPAGSAPDVSLMSVAGSPSGGSEFAQGAPAGGMAVQGDAGGPTIGAAAVPEPSSVLLTALGLTALGLVTRRRKPRA